MDSKKKKKKALDYHALPKPGKIEVIPTKKYATQSDLSLAYSPGVAEPCLAIHKDKKNVYKYTSKGNLVAVISNGTAVLGLGDIGPEASKPVMEGKGLLFKIFADIDVFDIEVEATDVNTFVSTVKAIAPTFGGINLEDIKAPEAFEIEERLKNELDIPVMHDDQHGTAIISAAALINACEIAKKELDKVYVVVNGAGAAAISCTKLYIELGVKKENIVMLDSKGVIRQDRDNLTPQKAAFATDKDIHSLTDAINNADVFIGLSQGDVVSAEMIKSMAKNPIVFAMANPNPEIDYNLAIETRKDIIMATGRSDHPNQVNNVLGFPFIFRGALDVRATKINEEMKLAAVHALADLAKQPVPEQINIVYNEVNLSFGRTYIIPKPFDPRLIYEIPPAIAKAAMESGVATEPITDWEAYKDQLIERSGNSNKIIRHLYHRAKNNPKRIVFAEADHLDVLKAAQIVHDEKIGYPILLGRKDTILSLKKEIDFDEEVPIFDPKTDEEKDRKLRYAEIYWKENQRKGIKLLDAQKLMRERNYFGAMMVNTGEADGLLTGYSRNYPDVVKPMLDLIGMDKGINRIAASNLMITEKGPIFLADTTINANPTAEQLVTISRMTANLAKLFHITPNIAMLSYSNFGSSLDKECTKIAEAVKHIHKEYPNVIIDGEVQADFAFNNAMLKKQFPFSKLVDKKINILIFPNLDSANITYKLMKELYEAESVGPIIMGFKKPAHILQLGSSVDEMVNMAVITVIDAQEKERKLKNS
ncbi:MAG: NADP-dependent malic enzyme [Flavobacteriales bacterium]|nr:MAG: NADP-dependent malic enzyme [Flavobacteriales bacterium]